MWLIAFDGLSNCSFIITVTFVRQNITQKGIELIKKLFNFKNVFFECLFARSISVEKPQKCLNDIFYDQFIYQLQNKARTSKDPLQ